MTSRYLYDDAIEAILQEEENEEENYSEIEDNEELNEQESKSEQEEDDEGQLIDLPENNEDLTWSMSYVLLILAISTFIWSSK